VKINVVAAAGVAALAVATGAGIHAVQNSIVETPAPFAELTTQSVEQHTQNQCDVRVHFVVNHAGNESIRITGQCAGHAPTAGQIQRLAKPLVLPPWVHLGRVVHDDTCGNSHSADLGQILWGGRHGITTVLVCKSGHSYLS